MCKNCFNGCLDPVSDKCVKYTGTDVPELGIENGDSLFFVEEKLISYLKTVIIGSGVFPILTEDNICELVQSNLPVCAECEGISLNQILDALLLSVCQIQEQLVLTQQSISNINANYTPGCVSGITGTEGTHDVLQAVINKVCTISTNLTALQLNLSTNYVSVSSINTYIQNYIDNISSNSVNSKMIPYVAVPYFGPLTYFDITGAGTGTWTKIYLCNGINPGVPDLRGRTLVGATTMGSNPFNSVVDPGIAGNPTYSLNSTFGANQVTLSETQLPSHTHSATVTDAGHSHDFKLNAQYNVTHNQSTANVKYLQGAANTNNLYNADSVFNNQDYIVNTTTGVTVTNGNTGGGLAHNNIQPSLGCYFIIYIP